MEEYKAIISEILAETSEELMEKFFAEEPFTHEEIIDALSKGLFTGSITVFASSATTREVTALMDMIASSSFSFRQGNMLPDDGDETELTLPK